MTGHSSPTKALIVGRVSDDALEGSYARAFRHMGIETAQWNSPAAIGRSTRGGRVGTLVNQFLPVEAWTAKASRELLLRVIEERLDLVVVMGSSRVLPGALAQIKASRPECKLVLIWPDTMLNCYSHTIGSIPLYDLIATYSVHSLDPFNRLGARKMEWVPLAFDPELHPPELEPETTAGVYADCDASFVGNYSPEREELVTRLIGHGFRIKVWGPTEWQRSAKDRKALAKYWQGRELLGRDYCLAIKSAPVRLNPISPLNFPAANMRFFEILGSGGTPLSAACPEMEAGFPNQEACFYYDDAADAAEILKDILSSRDSAQLVARRGQERVLAAHTYVHRAQQILNALSVPSQPRPTSDTVYSEP